VSSFACGVFENEVTVPPPLVDVVVLTGILAISKQGS
jgi:hypothetical protein